MYLPKTDLTLRLLFDINTNSSDVIIFMICFCV
jgi:hypothetical protein